MVYSQHIVHSHTMKRSTDTEHMVKLHTTHDPLTCTPNTWSTHRTHGPKHGPIIHNAWCNHMVHNGPLTHNTWSTMVHSHTTHQNPWPFTHNLQIKSTAQLTHMTWSTHTHTTHSIRCQFAAYKGILKNTSCSDSLVPVLHSYEPSRSISDALRLIGGHLYVHLRCEKINAALY